MLSLSLLEPCGPISTLWEIRGTDEQIKRYHKETDTSRKGLDETTYLCVQNVSVIEEKKALERRFQI